MKINIILDIGELKFNKRKIAINEGLEFIAFLTDHAILNKNEIVYLEEERCFNMKLRRNDYSSHRHRLPIIRIWRKNKFKLVDCFLKIKYIESYKIKDEDDLNNNEVIIGPLIYYDEGFYLGSFCEKGNIYELNIKVSKVDLSIEDII